jgi:hypothetical protein
MWTDGKPEPPSPGPLMFPFYPSLRQEDLYSLLVHKSFHSDSSIVLRIQAINNKPYIR